MYTTIGYTRPISLLAYTTVVYTSSEIYLAYTTIGYTNNAINLGYTTIENEGFTAFKCRVVGYAKSVRTQPLGMLAAI